MGLSDSTFSARLKGAEARPRRRRTGLRIRNAILIALAFLIPSLVCVAFAGTLGPAWAAHEGHGTAGIWTATAEHCQRSCTWTGTFTVPMTSHTYTIPAGAGGPASSFTAPVWGYDLENTTLGAGITIDHLGQSVPAVDTGGVFPRGGGSAWIRDVIMMTLGGICVLAWLWVFPKRALRRLRRSYAYRHGVDYS